MRFLRSDAGRRSCRRCVLGVPKGGLATTRLRVTRGSFTTCPRTAFVLARGRIQAEFDANHSPFAGPSLTMMGGCAVVETCDYGPSGFSLITLTEWAGKM
jgi:hypothetical protein